MADRIILACGFSNAQQRKRNGGAAYGKAVTVFALKLREQDVKEATLHRIPTTTRGDCSGSKRGRHRRGGNCRKKDRVNGEKPSQTEKGIRRGGNTGRGGRVAPPTRLLRRPPGRR